MGMQILIEDTNAALVAQALSDAGISSEVFPVSDGRVGVSIPTAVIDSVGEDLVSKVLSIFTYVDLWSGERSLRRG
ncbi:hypothetical protein FIV34_17640 [Luteibacter pinisoli]|uniref:DUF2007 domain-containing protein n=1 Tax=Luteibacter pinisoli TaxID=2589080 RepID=A0A4Y5Z9P5_9GAMM|nr:hypothetical protein [Luteibacter pinisoli]QDE40903.1 hypothetical protein FIV34_17640 [Luteibacter pinisoli]